MNKQAQGLTNFLSELYKNSLRPPITNQEAKALYSLWMKGKRDEYGKLTVNAQMSPEVIASLQLKGVVQAPLGIVALHKMPTVELTDKGREIIRQIILYAERSSFEPENDLDYEAIYRQHKMGPTKKASKTASVQPNLESWCQKAARKEILEVRKAIGW